MVHKQRIEGIDLCKALGICLVVLGHFLETDSLLKICIYSFHVPLFFVLSGYTQNENSDFSEFLIRKIKTLLIPYFIYFILSLPYYLITKTQVSLITLLKRFFMTNGRVIWNSPLWFLPILFVISIITYLLVKHCHIYLQLSIGVGLWLLGFLVYQNNVLNRFGINKIIFCYLSF